MQINIKCTEKKITMINMEYMYEEKKSNVHRFLMYNFG